MRTLILAALFLCAFVSSASADLVAYWNFNGLTTATNNGTSYAPDSGSGSLDITVAAADQAGSNRGINSFAGTTLNRLNSDVAGQAVSVQGGASESTTPVQNNGATIVLQFNLSALLDPILTYATQGTATGFQTVVLAYSTDGSTYTDFNTYTPATSFAVKTFDFSAINALDGASTAFFRLTMSGATSNAGNNRFDNIQLNAVPEASPVLFGAMICGVVGLAYGGRKLRRKGQASSV